MLIFTQKNKSIITHIFAALWACTEIAYADVSSAKKALSKAQSDYYQALKRSHDFSKENVDRLKSQIMTPARTNYQNALQEERTSRLSHKQITNETSAERKKRLETPSKRAQKGTQNKKTGKKNLPLKEVHVLLVYLTQARPERNSLSTAKTSQKNSNSEENNLKNLKITKWITNIANKQAFLIKAYPC